MRALGIDNHKAARAFAGGGCGKTGLRQGQVKHAALARAHRRERKGLAGGANLLDGHLGHKGKLAVAVGLKAFCVEGDAVMILRFEAKDLGCDMLDGVEKLAVAGEEQGSIGAGQFDCDFWICITKAIG